MNALYTRLALCLLMIMLLVGGGFYAVEQWSAQRYHEEVTQRLNADIAMYVTDQTTLITAGEVNRPELERLAQQAMVINPSVEVYLLDRDGRILGHALPPESVLLQQVDLTPLQALISGDSAPPAYAADPRNPAREKVFSAAPVMDGETLQGYLYVVLGGSKYDMLAGAVRDSYTRTTSIVAIGALVIGGFLAGLLVFALLTRRLTRLTRAVDAFSRSGMGSDAQPMELEAFRDQQNGSGDEIDKLAASFTSMANKIHEQFDALQENDRLRRELTSNVSHDLRTPLATMHGYIDTLLLKNQELDAAAREHYLKIARKHTQRLGTLVGDLFELSKLDAGATPLALETFSLSELLHDVVQDFELEAQRRSIEIKLACPPGRALVRADIALLQRVLENLIRNALQYTPAGGSITLDLTPSPQNIAVGISDTGCGIPAEEIGNIFERYFRSNLQRSGSEQSSGLGLAIVKRILDLHGSRITVTSRTGEGTRFEFDLPAAAA